MRCLFLPQTLSEHENRKQALFLGRSIRLEKNSWGKSLYVQGKVPVDLPDFIDDSINVGLENHYASGTC